MLRRAALLLFLLLVQLGQVLSASPSHAADPQLPAPWLPPDPGARCPGFLPCPEIDPWAITLKVDGWMSPGTSARGSAGGLRAGLSLDLARRFELGISGALLAWDVAPDLPRAVGLRLVSAHARAILWPLLSAPTGRLTVLAAYQHDWAGDVSYGLLQPGGTFGRGNLSVHLPLWDSLVSVGTSAGAAYDPERGNVLAELGVRASVLPPDPDHHVSLYIEAGAQVPVRGAAGSVGGWGAAGFTTISTDWGLELGGGVLFSRGAEDGLPGVMFQLRAAQHFGSGYTPPRWGTTPEEAEARALAQQREQLAPALLHIPPQEFQRYLQQLRGQQLDQVAAAGGASLPGTAYSPGDWYPPAQEVQPGPPGLHTPLGPYLQPPHPRTHQGQAGPLPPPRALPPRYPTRTGPGPAPGRGVVRGNPEIAAEAETPGGRVRGAIKDSRPPPELEEVGPLRGGQELPSPIPSIRPPGWTPPAQRWMGPPPEENICRDQPGRAFSSSSTRAEQLKANAAQGKAFEQEGLTKLEETDTAVSPQVTVEVPSGLRVRPDAISRDRATGKVRVTDWKSSQTAPHTKNQRAGYPELETHGGVVVGEGKPGFPGGTVIPPTKVDVIRPK